MSFSHCFQRYRDPAFTISPYNRLMRAAVITVSDSCFRGERVDISGPAVADLLRANAFQVISHLVVPDEQPDIEVALRQQCEVVNLVVTTGGTGIAPRDVTPEATRAVCHRLLDGFAELMRAEGRKQTQFASLSRSLSGTRGRSLIVNLPGSPRAARTSLEALLPLIPHALTLLEGIATGHDEENPPLLR
jgi:molybdopterin adenylyltransferase